MSDSSTPSPVPSSAGFSLVLGGPLFQVLRRAHLADDALLLLRKRVLVVSLFAWLPLLALSLLRGQALSGVAVPFLKDVESHVRFLFAMPLLIVAELAVHRRMQPVLQLFRERGVVPPALQPRLQAAADSALRLRNSVLAELLLVALVYGLGVQVVWRRFIALDAATWYATPLPGGTALSPAGLWYGYVSLPIFQFLLCRWYFRIFIWARFLWQVAKIKLSLVPTHPDRLGGLGFLTAMAHAFMPLAAAHGALVAGTLANRILYTGARLTAFRMELLLVVVLMLLLVFGPVLVFAPQLAAARRRGLNEYGTLAERYVREFDAKWLRGGAASGEALLGSADVQSLADMVNGHDVVRTMASVPVSKEAILRVALATLAPVVPLALTMMPLEELLKRLFGMLF